MRDNNFRFDQIICWQSLVHRTQLFHLLYSAATTIPTPKYYPEVQEPAGTVLSSHKSKQKQKLRQDEWSVFATAETEYRIQPASITFHTRCFQHELMVSKCV